MNDIISVLSIVLVFQILTSHVELYNLTCPSVAHWKIRAKVKCNSTLKYVCLYNNVKEIYVEGCNGPDWDRKDNKCIESSFKNETKYKKRNGHRESSDSREQVKLENTNVVSSEPTLKNNRKMSRAAIILTVFCAVTIAIAVLFSKLTIDEGCRICQKGNLSIEEINYLRLVRLLFKVAHPVVRKIFDNVIAPNQLRTTLDRCKTLLEKEYRDTKIGINDFQWNLLYDQLQGKTVTSKDFDIRLMLLLLRTLANYKISDVYEDKSDKSTYAKISRIKYVRNEITRRFAGKLSKSLFDQYRDDISQTLQETKHTEHGQAETQQIGCLGVVRCVQKATDFKLPDPTIEENNFLVVFHVIAIIVYPVLQNAYNTCTPLEKNKTEQHQTHCSDEESKNLYIRMMLDTLIQGAKQNGESDRIIHLEEIKGIQREIVQSCSGVLTETRFHVILKSMREAVLYLGGTFSEEKLLELQKIRNILE